ncbi:unnamed protein product [Blepharisma stoltei]|uniref:Cyclic nucleotide-binding domain-containing protein n=1 Tax=Blepharisma stoltei TaxID=1481888 RepID=A0AAU9J8D9_9CILI|nr:unnamed protein product [Blepharisma stoltei]
MEMIKKHDQKTPDSSTLISNEQSQPPLTHEDRIHTLKKLQSLHSSNFYIFHESKIKESWDTAFIFHPNRYFRIIWDILILCCTLYLAISIPVFLFFVIPVEDEWVYIEFAVQIMFILDIFVSLNTGYFYKGALVMIRTMMAKHYLEKWLFLDLLSSFPWVWLVTGSVFENEKIAFEENTNTFNSIKFSRIIRLLKLLKFLKMEKVIVDIEDYFKNQLASIWFLFIKLLSRVLLIAHWAACLFFYVSYTNITKQSDNWLMNYQILVEDEVSKTEFYISSMYWAITTMVSVGYGDLHPISTVERFYGIFAMVCLSATFVNIIGNLSSLISAASAKEDKYRIMIQAINRYMKKKKLSTDLQFRVRSYIDYMHEVDVDYEYDEQNIIDLFSGPLKDEIYDHLHGHVIKSCILFNSGIFSKELVIHLPRLLTYQAYAPEDSIFEEGEASRSLYFIMSGEVEVYHPTSKACYTTLGHDKYFGEIGFLVNAPRCASVKSMSFTEVFLMSFQRFYEVLCVNPEDDKALILLEKKCKDMDYSSIYVSCYLCKTLGHVAARCKSLIFNLDQEHTRNVWLEGRKMRGRKIPVNPEELVNRRNNRIREGFYGSFNDKFAALNRYKDHEALIRKVEDYYIDMETPSSANLFRKVRQEEWQSMRQFSGIYKITESDEESVEETVRQPTFDVSLMGNSMRVDPSKPFEISIIGESSRRDDDTRSEIL